jgi:hypothetical protein
VSRPAGRGERRLGVCPDDGGLDGGRMPLAWALAMAMLAFIVMARGGAALQRGVVPRPVLNGATSTMHLDISAAVTPHFDSEASRFLSFVGGHASPSGGRACKISR